MYIILSAIFTIVAALLLILVSLLDVTTEWRKVIMCMSGSLWLLSGVFILMYEIKTRQDKNMDKSQT
jgi:uncharacterized membrane protein HdeD (DUF308 family)